MAFASVTYTSASGTTFALTNSDGNAIEYLRQSDISVTVNGTLQTLTTDYTFNAAGTAIVLNSAVSGATVVLSRATSITDATVSFTAGSTLTAQDLNNSDKQNRFALQEFSDLYGGLITGTGDLEALGGFIGSTETWVSDNAHAATTGAIEARVDSKIDDVLTGNVVAGNAITITDDSPASGQITIAVTDGAIDTAELANNAVTTAKITDSNVTTAKINDSAVTTAKINDAAVTTAKLANDSVTSDKIADGTIIAGDIANNAVTTAKIADSNVTTTKIANGAVTNAKVNASAAIAGTKIDPDFGSQTVETTGVFSAAGGAQATPSITFTGDLNTGIYSPGADQLAISTNSTGRLFIDASGRVGVGIANPGRSFVVDGVDDTIVAAFQSTATGCGFGLKDGTTTADNTVTLRAIGNDLVANAGGTERLRITSTGELQFKGNGTNGSPGSPAVSFSGSAPSNSLVIISTGRLGLGTSAPSAGLTVGLGSTSVPAAGSSGSSGPAALFGNSVGLQTYGLAVGATTAGLGYIQAQRADGTATTYNLTIQPNGGNVGIGTTSPDALLDVENSSGASEIQIKSLNASDCTLAFGDNADTDVGRIRYAHSANAMLFFTGANERCRIDSSGRLLVGTSSDTSAAKFIVQGLSSDSTAQGLIDIRRGTRPTAADTEIGSIRFKSGATDTRYAQISCFSDGASSSDLDIPGRLVFSTTADGASAATERMRITSSGQIQANGLGTAAAPILSFTTDNNTGIYSPGADQVAISTNGQGRLFVDASGDVRVEKTAAAQTALFSVKSIGGGGTTAKYALDCGSGTVTGDLLATANADVLGTGGLVLQTTTSHPIVFRTNSSGNEIGGNERLRITSDGKVGLGTSSPAADLHLSKTTGPVFRIGASASGGNNASTGRIEFYGGSSAGDGPGIKAVIDTESTTVTNRDFNLLFKTSTNVGSGEPLERLRINANGRVGIGTTSPGSALEIDAAAATSPFIAKINTAEAARIDSSGRLLVGTSTALSGSVYANFNSGNALLQVVGNSSGNPRGATFALGRSQAASGIIANDFIGGVIFSDNASAEFAHIFCFADAAAGTGDHPSRLVFSTTADGANSPTERMRIDSTGRSTYNGTGSIVISAETSSSAGTTNLLYKGRHSSTGLGSGTDCFVVYSNGNVVNTNNSYGALSDIKLKENIVDASSQWDDLKALQVRNYNLKEGQTHTQIGLVAQEVELVSPGLVSESPDRDEDGNDLGTVTKSVNYSVLYMKAVKALQEAMERIETLEQRLNDAGIA